MAKGWVYEDSATGPGWRVVANGDLPTSGVTAATYGDATHVAQVAVNAQGIITSASNVAITGGSGSSPLTTKGDLYGHDTADNRIPVGSNGQLLTADSGQALGLKWANSGVSAATYGDSAHVAQFTVNAAGLITSASSVAISGGTPSFIGARIYNSAAQNVSNNSNANVQYDSTDYDTNSMADLANDKLIAKTAGYYAIVLQIGYAASSTGRRLGNVTQNGDFVGATGTTQIQFNINPPSSGTFFMTASAVIHMALNDYITAGTFQNSGAGLNMSTGVVGNSLTAVLIGV